MQRFPKVLMIAALLVGAIGGGKEAAQAQPKASQAAAPKTALTGLDPIEFLAGRAVQGNKNISYDYNHFRYVFANQKNRASFVKDPNLYSIQGDGSCPVAPDAKVDPGIVTVYKGRIYAFATLGCVGLFHKDPEKFLARWPGNPDKKKP